MGLSAEAGDREVGGCGWGLRGPFLPWLPNDGDGSKTFSIGEIRVFVIRDGVEGKWPETLVTENRL